MTITLLLLAALTVDFNKDIGPVRRELHSSGFGPRICSCPQSQIDAIKSMGFKASRTHDWALINKGQRVCDWYFLFPLANLDATDPKNYVFGPTDYLLKRTREELGHDIFFRLGASIEHSGEVHFNALVPDDFDKVAEVFAGTVRHYNKGWANGYKWDIEYWEIWNEPDGDGNMWFRPGKPTDEEYRKLYCDLFIVCLKRLKSEFPDIKVGGPALCRMNEEYFRYLFGCCKEAGVAPDFISWHYYTDEPKDLTDTVASARRIADEEGFPTCELIIDEWHYLGSHYGFSGLRSTNPEMQERIWNGPHSHNGIDSSCFNLAVLSQFQTLKLDQGYYYGCSPVGNWGFMDERKRKYKVFYGMQLFGDFVSNYARLCAATGDDPVKEPVITVLAGKSADGGKRAVLVSDYRVQTNELVVTVKGVPVGSKVTARVHDDGHDLAPADFAFEGEKLTLRKQDAESAAFLVEFE